MEHGGAGCLSQGHFRGYADGALGLEQIGVHATGAEDRDADALGRAYSASASERPTTANFDAT
jgi:hypothetical protein